MKLYAIAIFVFILLFSFQFKDEVVIRMYSTSIKSEVVKVDTLTLSLSDTIPNKTIKIYSDKNGYPIKYSRDITTGVCIDGECRIVAINLFWNVTGRYLGFELPDGEFLSKTEHDPFNAKEYTRLHEILSEPNSPLGTYSIKELVPETNLLDPDIDAVTSATIEEILEHIVEGAVYTTHTLWHIVYGETKRKIEKLSVQKLNAELSLQILNSNILRDQVWVLNHISAEMEISTDLEDKLMELIRGKDIYLSERGLNALKPESMTHDIQLKLAQIFPNAGFLQKRIIIQKFKESEKLYPDVVHILTSEIKELNGTLTKNVLDLYGVHNIDDVHSVSEISELLKHDNSYISKYAMLFLETIESLDKEQTKAIEKYKKRNS